MRLLKFASPARVVVVLTAALLGALPAAAADWREITLYSFGATATDGSAPYSGVIIDGGGKLYGTTDLGGTNTNCLLSGYPISCGTVFELRPSITQDGDWTERVLSNLGATAAGPHGPFAGLVLDGKGKLYGTTVWGGANNSANGGDGTVFRLKPPLTAGGEWKITVLDSFGATATDGVQPVANLIIDADGNLYGTTPQGGAFDAAQGGDGTAFELSPPAKPGGEWTKIVLYNFGATASDGIGPHGAMIMSKGKLYGTTAQGGAPGACQLPSACGTVFELSPPAVSGDAWQEAILYSFGATATDGQDPLSGVIADAKGNLYGTTYQGGAHSSFAGSDGTAFELSPPAKAGGAWTETILHDFGATANDGIWPFAPLTMDAKGNLYGTTFEGGGYNAFDGGEGIAFKLKPPVSAAGEWTETIIHDFGATLTDGAYPRSGIIFDAKGNLYGTTSGGGKHAAGTVYELIP